MRSFHAVALLLSAAVLAACGEERSPTAPESESLDIVAAGQRVVNSVADPGDGTCNATQCTLREAIRSAGATTITFAPGLTGPIVLASPAAGGGPLGIGKSLTITGPSGGIVIRRRSADPAFRIMRVGSGVTATLRNLTLAGGETDLLGGGIINLGTLTLTGCKVLDNSSTQRGGGISNHGRLTLVNTTMSRNTAPVGAGINNHNNMTATLTNSTVRRNAGTGIHNEGTLTISRGEISHNGVGLKQQWGRSSLDRVRIAGNVGAGIAHSDGSVTIANSTIARNGAVHGGGGIRNGPHGHLTVLSSTVSANKGGGISSEAGIRRSVWVQVTNSTVSGNDGDGISSTDDFIGAAHLTLLNSTVVFNSGIGIRQSGQEEVSLSLTNSLVALNGAGDISSGVSEASFVRAAYSLIGDGTGTGIENEEGNQVGNVSPYTSPIDPLIGLLAQNGGPTSTHALLAGSPAIDAGTSEDCPATDQRGVARPQGAACDVGSFERE